MSNQLTRRSLLKGSLYTAAALGMPMAGQVWGKSTKATGTAGDGVAGANEDLRIAVIGLNGRGKSHTDAYTKMKGVRLVALCDADEAVLRNEVDRLNKGPSKSTTKPTSKPASAGNERANKPLKLDLFTDLRKLLDSKDIDAISIATPNHWHALMAIWGVQAGKDVYVEKPVSHNVWEGRKIVEASRKYNKIVQAGTQSRSSESIREAFEWIKAGNLGKIQVARGLCYKRRGSIGKTEGPQKIPETVDYDLWCGPAAKEELRRKSLHYDWHWFWNTGNGDFGNQGIHQMDIARWALGKQELSPKVMSVGGRFGYVDDGQTPNTQFVVHDYGDMLLIFEVRGLYEKPGGSKMPTYRGQDVGNIIECEGGYVSMPHDGTVAYDKDGKKIREFKDKGEDHFANFIKAVRSRRREDQNADILEGHLSSALCHTGNISYRLGQEANPEDDPRRHQGRQGGRRDVRAVRRAPEGQQGRPGHDQGQARPDADDGPQDRAVHRQRQGQRDADPRVPQAVRGAAGGVITGAPRRERRGAKTAGADTARHRRRPGGAKRIKPTTNEGPAEMPGPSSFRASHAGSA